jgi:hypothetical protein
LIECKRDVALFLILLAVSAAWYGLALPIVLSLLADLCWKSGPNLLASEA